MNPFDFREKEVKISDSVSIPLMGLGTATLKENCDVIVYDCIRNGCRMIDTAQTYGNEEAVGRAVKRAIDEGLVKREDMFIISKVGKINYERAEESIEESLKLLDLGYIDAMIVHQIGEGDKEVYNVICSFIDKGKIRAVALSNIYDFKDYTRLTSGSSHKPVFIQNENNVFFQDQGIKEAAEKENCAMMAYFSLCGRQAKDEVMGNDLLRSIARSHHATIPQIIFRFQLQSGYIIIPGIDDPSLYEDNLRVFAIELNEKEMELIRGLDQKKRHGTW